MSKSNTRLAVNGAAGRMGRQLLAAIQERDEGTLSAAIDRSGQACIGVDASVLCAGIDPGITVVDSLPEVVSAMDVLIDFSSPQSSLAVLDCLSGTNVRPVIGTTGFNAEQLARMREHAEEMPIMFAPNYSIGVTLTLSLLHDAASALGDDYDVEVIEAHHRNKVDAPSGTAVRMGEVLADALGRDLSECAVYGREGITGVRDVKTIGFETIRAGDIIGEHTVLFAGNGERLEITHKATDRMSFARGAVRAGLWLANQPPGLYDMSDVLGLRR